LRRKAAYPLSKHHRVRDQHTTPTRSSVYIGQLRRKIEANPDNPNIIITEPGIGLHVMEGSGSK